jgi:predicted nuclease of predicted toxin-antitoxin system
LKLEENLGSVGRDLLVADGHDVMTVSDQSLGGSSDESLFQVCCDEGRALVTLDQDFAQTLRFPPRTGRGLIVLRIGGRVTPGKIELCIQTLVQFAKSNDVDRSLWIVEPARVRLHE